MKTEVKKAIKIATAEAAMTGLIPIPIADSAVLLPIQAKMIADIYKAYDKKITDGLINGVLTSMTAATIGKSVAGGVFKLVPGVGTVVGGFISGTIAVSITQAMGYAVAKGLEEDKIETTNDLMAVLASAIQFVGKRKR